jgi:glycosyltransferase involved in cell wall biosynthesis
MYYSIVHLVDDATVGGVTRTVEFVAGSPELARTGVHKIVKVRRGQLSAPKFSADLVVSHLSVSWRNLPFFAALRAAYPRTPLVHIEHSYSERFVAMNVKHSARFETLMRSVMAIFDRVVAVSETQGQWMRRKGYCPGGRVDLIESCADITPFLDTVPRGKVAPKVIGVIGRAEVQKGVDILVEAFQDDALNHLELHIYGDGGELKALKAQAKGRANIVFKGFTSDPAAAMAACDVIAMPSRWEPYGIVAVEAMAAGRPVLCSRVDGTDTHIAGGALEVAQNTASGWVAMLSNLETLNLELAVARGRLHARAARKRFINAWTDLIHTSVAQPEPERLAA